MGIFREHDVQVRAAPGHRFDFKIAAKGGHSFPDYKRSLPLGFEFQHAEPTGEIKSAAVVVNQESPVALVLHEPNRNISRPAVLFDVQQRFFNNPHKFTSDCGRR